MHAKSPFQKGSNPKPENYAKLFGEEEGGCFTNTISNYLKNFKFFK
jgi:hypothetical protein